MGGWIGFSWLGEGPVAGCCECGDEPSRSGATELVIYTNRCIVLYAELGRE
jgi:hypothetical protein